MAITAGGDILASDFTTIKTAVENIALGEAVCIVPTGGVETQAYSPSVTATTGSVALNWAAQAFTTSASAVGIGRLRVYLSETNGSGNVSYNIYIRSTLTGANLWSGGLSNFGGGAWREYTPNITLSASTTYYVIVTYDSPYDTKVHWHTNTADPIPANIPYTSDDGVTWSAGSGYHHSMEVKELIGTAGQIALASSVRNDARFYNHIGFAQSAILASASGIVRVNKLMTGLTGLTVGRYYLSDTHGAIATSAGSNTKLVGIAVSATELVIS